MSSATKVLSAPSSSPASLTAMDSKDKSTALGVNAYDPTAYESAFFYESGAYETWMVRMVQQHLVKGATGSLSDGDDTDGTLTTDPTSWSWCDVGAGGGAFTMALNKELRTPKERISCVEPQSEFGQKIQERGFTWIPSSASDFFRECRSPHSKISTDRSTDVAMEDVGEAKTRDGAAGGGVGSSGSLHFEEFDRVLFKESVHFIPKPELNLVFRGVWNSLKPASSLSGGYSEVLVVGRPEETLLPFFEAAKDVYRRDTPPMSTYMDAMKTAGFRNVSMECETYECRVPKAQWLAMLRGRFWSTLFPFSKDELDRGVREVEAKYADEENLIFRDMVCFLRGYKVTV